jgi:hypothetical protein
MRLTSDYSEIVLYSTKVPGYWARQVGDAEKFFLYTLDGSYKKGDVISVDGAFGTATVAVFDDETRVYQSDYTANIFVVWRAALSSPRQDGQPTSRKVPAE